MATWACLDVERWGEEERWIVRELGFCEASIAVGGVGGSVSGGLQWGW